jgi:hypothetical protein
VCRANLLGLAGCWYSNTNWSCSQKGFKDWLQRFSYMSTYHVRALHHNVWGLNLKENVSPLRQHSSVALQAFGMLSGMLSGM